MELDQQEPMPQDNEKTNGEVAGLIWRALAILTDILILFIPLLLLGYFFRDFAYSLGPYGRFIGYALIISYFGIFNAGIRKGQTIGKWVWGVVVVDKDNNYLSLGRSFGRALILSLIFMLNQWLLPILENQILALIVKVVVIGGLFSLFYSIVLNRTTRQGIHDLLVGSYVVKEPLDKGKALPKIPTVHQALTFGLLGIGLVLLLGGSLSVPYEGPTVEMLGTEVVSVLYSSSDKRTSGLFGEDEWDGLNELQGLLLENDEYFTVKIDRRIQIDVSDSSIFQDLTIELWAKTSCITDQKYCRELIMETAEIAFKHFDSLEELGVMSIRVVNHFDLGLSSGSFSQDESRLVKDWQIALAE